MSFQTYKTCLCNLTLSFSHQTQMFYAAIKLTKLSFLIVISEYLKITNKEKLISFFNGNHLKDDKKLSTGIPFLKPPFMRQ